jgi:hypothetical protein
MNVYLAIGHKPSRWHEEPDDLNERVCVVASTESEALGFVLDKFTDSAKEDWTIFRVNLEKTGVFDHE